jgi:hypothetical protein
MKQTATPLPVYDRFQYTIENIHCQSMVEVGSDKTFCEFPLQHKHKI